MVDAALLSVNHIFFPNADILKPAEEEDTVQYWQRVEHSWQWRRSQFERGLIEVTVSGTEPTKDSLPAENCLAIPEASDRFNEYSVLTGWGENA